MLKPSWVILWGLSKLASKKAWQGSPKFGLKNCQYKNMENNKCLIIFNSDGTSCINAICQAFIGKVWCVTNSFFYHK